MEGPPPVWMLGGCVAEEMVGGAATDGQGEHRVPGGAPRQSAHLQPRGTGQRLLSLGQPGARWWRPGTPSSQGSSLGHCSYIGLRKTGAG